MVLGALLIVVYFFKHYETFRQSHVKKDVSSYKYSYPRCEQNMTVSSIPGFSEFSDMLKDFLYYRHCRHFPILLDLPDKCRGSDEPKDIFLLLVIKSFPIHYERREVLRKTWAKERSYKGMWIRRIFIIGTMTGGFEKERMNNLLKREQQEYNDILQWDFNDTFFNLTLKQVLFLDWMNRNCPYVHFLLNGDDDIFANTDNIVDYLQTLHDNNGNQHLFTGHLIQNAYPIRWPTSKYFVPSQLYDSKFYPPYCGGGGFVLSGFTALMINSFSESVPIFPIDDVYMGMCLAKAKLAPASHMAVKTLGWKIPSKNVDQYDPCYFKEQVLVHRFYPEDMYLLWHQIHDPNLKCGIEVMLGEGVTTFLESCKKL
uniref:Hexosyltransferase n=1 Tax=Amphilophus citrinellus TaxID=61819 RepID=A0A3Q0R4T1_AMPCI